MGSSSFSIRSFAGASLSREVLVCGLRASDLAHLGRRISSHRHLCLPPLELLLQFGLPRCLSVGQLIVKRLVLLDVQSVPLVEQLLIPNDCSVLDKVLVNFDLALLVSGHLSQEAPHLTLASNVVKHRSQPLRIQC